MIKRLLKIKSSFPSRIIRSCLKMLVLKVDINLLNQHYKLADWQVDWLTDLLRRFDSQGTKDTRAVEHLKHSRHSRHSGTRKALGFWGTQGTWTLGHFSKNTRALKALKALEGHLETRALKGTWALEHSRHLGTWPLRHLGTRALERHSGTWDILFSRLACEWSYVMGVLIPTKHINAIFSTVFHEISDTMICHYY